MHGGTIVAESSDQDGTVFSARLPRIPPGVRPEVRSARG
jgi:signal transduction histidine kinase